MSAGDRSRQRPIESFVSTDDLAATGQEWLLWPVRVFRVTAPVKATRDLDLFERVVLELAVAGSLERLRLDEAAAALHLDRELIRHVAFQLQRKHLLTQDFRPTPAGLLAAHDARVEDHGDVLGWMYRAEWSGRVWPLLQLATRRHVEAKWRDGSAATIVLGEAGRPVRRDGRVLRGDWDVAELTDLALRDSLEGQECRTRSAVSDADLSVDVSRVERFSIVSPEQSIFLASPVWSTDESGRPCVRDPLTGEADGELEELLVELCANDERLKTFALAGRGGEDVEPSPVLPDDSAVAELRLEEHVGPWLRGTRIWGRAIELERALLAAELAAGGSRPERLRAVLTEAQATLELLFQSLLSAFDARDAAAGIVSCERGNKPVEKENARVVQACARRFGASVPWDMAVQGRRALDKALTTGQESLRALVTAAVLSMGKIAGHPLADALRRDPELLKRIDRIAARRNKAAHASEVPLELVVAQEMVFEVRHALRLIRMPPMPASSGASPSLTESVA